ncbi:GDYXXLXY domain-containing protein [Paenibacillus lutrae]|uniref:DUF2157 domain-containing protein n=1 Tax=Paenibacillus lutrae TaxID=2078573 RepID=A0A7X3FJ07_9BACL|nr:GDYXXLXY domain-containing protein [Paenibacillus lutrae]MVP00613.1 DUF2157 domain-containing protein [Paenibacillus lutrae]
MLQLNVIRTGFLLGISLVLSAIIYFFAANWGGLDRIEKVLLSAGLVLLFYGLCFIWSRFRGMLGHHTFLSNLFLAGGCIAFGISVALLGQIYNSHADSYGLFLIWSVPALLFAWITRYSPFYLLSYVLIHLTLWFYFYPSAIFYEHRDEKLMLIGVLFAVINLVVFVWTERERLQSAPLKFISFIIFHLSLLFLTDSTKFENAGLWMNIPCIAAISAGFYYFTKIRLNKMYLTLNALAASAFAVFKFFELAAAYSSTAFFVYGLVFVALLLTANAWFFRYLNKLDRQESESAAEHTHQDAPPEQSSALVGKIVSSIVTVIGVIIGSVSLLGVVLLATDARDPENTIFMLSLFFIIPMVLIPRMNAAVRYTLLTIGYIAGLLSLVLIDKPVLSSLFLILSIAGWLRMEGRIQRLFTYALTHINLAVLIYQLLSPKYEEFAAIVLILFVLNAVMHLYSYSLKKDTLWQPVRESSLFFALLFLFWLTFLDDIFPYSRALFTVLNFLLVTFLVFLYIRQNKTAYAYMSLFFWFSFLVYKYYDLLWNLLHKSVTLALLGLLTFAVTYIAARRTGANDTSTSVSFVRASPLLITVTIVLQLGFIGYQAAAYESLLKNGTSIKLEIEPLDPRSLLQGDYVNLRYTISSPAQSTTGRLDQESSQSKVKVVLVPDKDGIYTFGHFLAEGDTLAGGEVVINGEMSGGRFIYYGIETYFVPEGTGLEVERNARYAYVRVNADGDARIEKLARD